MANIMNERAILAQIGNPTDVAHELKRFSKSARRLSSAHPRMIDIYPKQWIAVYNGQVKAHARSLKYLMTQIDKKGLPRNRIVIRFIDRQRRAMILTHNVKG